MILGFGSSSIFFAAFATSDFFGKVIFLGLFAVSLITWFILIQKVLLFRNVRKESNKFQEMILSYKDQILTVPSESLFSYATSPEKNPFSHIYLSLKSKTAQILEKNDFFTSSRKKEKEERSVFLSRADIELIDSEVGMIITKESKQLEKNLFILSTAVSLAPFLGILGTVWGVLVSLGDLRNGTSVHSNSVVLGGLSTALATTVLGLFIAIPALIAYNYLRTSLKGFYTEMEDFSHYLLSEVELQYRNVDIGS